MGRVMPMGESRCCLVIVTFACIATLFISPALSIRFMEMFVRTGEAIHSEADVDFLINKALETHIEGLSVLMKDDKSGLLYYSGSSVPATQSYNITANPDYDSLIKYLVSTAHQHGLKVYAWLPMFKDPVLAHARYELAAMRKQSRSGPLELSQLYVSPFNPEVRAHEQNIATEVLSKFPFDGIRLDFVQFDSDFSDLSNYTRAVFKGRYGIDPAFVTDLDVDAPNWKRWVDFRSAHIKSFLQEVVKAVLELDPTLDVGAYILPFAASAEGYYGDTRTGNDYSQYGGQWIKVMPLIFWQEWASADNFYQWVNETIFHANRLINAKVVPVFSVTDQYSASRWPPLLLNEAYLSRALDIATDNGCAAVSLSFDGKWSDEEFQQVAISGDRSMGMSLWNGKQLTLTIVFFLLTCYSFYRLETLVLSLI